MAPQRRLRGAAVEALPASCVEGVGAVLDLRPPGAKSARHLARGEVTTALYRRCHSGAPHSGEPGIHHHRRIHDCTASLKPPRAVIMDSGPAGSKPASRNDAMT